MQFGIVRLYCGPSGKSGFYNCQEIGLAKALVKAGHSVVVFFSNKDIKKITEKSIEKNILLVQVPVKAFGVHAVFNGLYLLKYKVDILQIAGDNQIFAPNLLRFCRKNNILAYTYNGTVQSNTTNRIKKAIFSLLLKRNIVAYNKHFCLAKTTHVSDQLKKLGVSKVLTAPVGIDTSLVPTINMSAEELRRHLDLPVSKKIILFVGRLEKYKRPECAVELLNVLSDEFYLVMIGEGSKDQEINALINMYHLEERICRIQKIPNKDIHEYYAASDYYVNFNTDEIFGMAILEAMYSGCTVVAHSAPGPNLVIKNGVVGYIADNIAEMKKIISTKQLLPREMISQYIEKNFTWDNTVKIIQHEILGEKYG